MSVKKDLATGILWTAMSKYSGIVISLVISAVLARLITPEEFGVIGIASVFISFFNILGDIGVGPAIIQRQNLTDKDLSNIHSFTIYLGILLSLIFFSFSGWIADFYEDVQLKTVCRLLSLNIMLTCTNIVPGSLQYKFKRFKFVALFSLCIQVLTGLVAVIYALNGGGVYALVLQVLVSLLITSIVYNYLAKIRFTIFPKFSSLQKIVGFASYQFLFNIVNYFSRNADKLIIGRSLGLTQLGYYDKSYRLMLMPLQHISFVIHPVILPIFAELQHNLRDVGVKYLKIYQFLAYLSFPLSVMLYFCAPELILIIFGDQWGPSVIPFQILSLSVSMQILTSTTGGIFQAIDATKKMFISGILGAVFVIVAFIVGGVYFKSLKILCIAYLIAQIFNAVQCFGLLFRSINVTLKEALYPLLKPLCISSVMLILLAGLNIYFKVSLFNSLLVKLLLGSTIWIVMMQTWADIKPSIFFKSILHSKKA